MLCHRCERTAFWGDQWQPSNLQVRTYLLRKDADEARLAQQVRQFGEGHGQEPLSTQQGDGAPPLVQQDVARAGVLLPEPSKLPVRDETKEPTYRLRKEMGLV